MSTVRAKFKVGEIRRHRGSRKNAETDQWEACELRTVVLDPVMEGSEENRRFWEASPSGRIEIGCANLEAAELFELGVEYYIDFTPAT